MVSLIIYYFFNKQPITVTEGTPVKFLIKSRISDFFSFFYLGQVLTVGWKRKDQPKPALESMNLNLKWSTSLDYNVNLIARDNIFCSVEFTPPEKIRRLHLSAQFDYQFLSFPI